MKTASRVRQRHHEQRDLRRSGLKQHVGKAKVHLSFARWMRQRQKDLTALLLQGSHGILDDRFATVKTMFVPETFEDTFGRVPLLATHLAIALQNLLDNRQKRFQLPLSAQRHDFSPPVTLGDTSPSSSRR